MGPVFTQPTAYGLKQRCCIFETRALTAEDPRAPCPKGFLGKLWAPQATLLSYMLALEDCPYMRVETPKFAESFKGDVNPLLQFSCARIAAKFSFGKTVLCVALVCASPCPRGAPTPLNILTIDGGASSTKNRLLVTKTVFKEQGRGVFPMMTLHHHSLIRSTLVVAAPAVISQWEDCVRTFAPHLTVFTVDNVKALRRFHALFQSPEMGSIDLVFLKAGKVTTAFAMEGEPQLKASQRAMTKAFAMMTEGHIWGRLIVDDFDTIRLATEDIFIPALFTWVISATWRATTVCQTPSPALTVESFVQQNCGLPILSAASDGLFDNILKLHCDDQYVHDHINTTTITFRRITVEGGNAVGILQDLGVPDDIVEMAAAGAVETAAERLGIKVSSVGELIERVLVTQTEKYRKAVRTLDRIVRARAAAAQSDLPHNSLNEIKAARNALKKEDDEAVVEQTLARLGRPGTAFKNAMHALEEWAMKSRDEHGRRLQRMRENVRQEKCQVCTVPFDGGSESYVVNCCQIVICGHCTLVGNDRTRRHYISRCPNCAVNIDPKRHLIYVGADLKLEAALTDKPLIERLFCAGDGAPPPPSDGEKTPAAERPCDYTIWDGEPRLRALLQLINGDAIQSVFDGEVPAIVEGLLEGRRAAPIPAGVSHKYLIFAMHAESTRQISVSLEMANVAHALLRGSRKEKDEAVRRFKSRDPADGSVNVLIATSSRDCAGLHLPEVTSLVLYHHHIDVQIAKQAIGRAQRVGRKYSLEVVEIFSEGEFGRFG
ncbi:NAD-dependent DNA ligase [Elysia marginata]|uniref:NAD-dependent DNA ligase n=1 Tax=Elysia marginata TaxID=1093978 RepID=A0AAV4H1F2_9GAST|nr:NAD-dependent DNA ligase [Elysia marginata]